MRTVAQVFRASCLGFVLSIGVSPSARADVLLSNLGSNDDTTVTISATLFDAVAVSFTTPGVSYSLTSVELRLAEYTIDGPVISIAADNSNVPGSSVGLFLNPAAGSNPGTYSFTPTSAILLDPSTKYWLVVDNTPDKEARWNGNGGTPSGLATFGSYRETADGSSWSDLSPATPSFAINGTAVPETSTWLAGMSMALIAVATAGRRRS